MMDGSKLNDHIARIEAGGEYHPWFLSGKAGVSSSITEAEGLSSLSVRKQLDRECCIRVGAMTESNTSGQWHACFKKYDN